MRKLNENTARFLLNEVSILKKENIIDEQTGQKLTTYYNEILKDNIQPVKQEKVVDRTKDGKHVNLVVIILGIVSAIFFGGAIITLIAFNWYLIPRNIKAISAVCILILTQIAAAVYLFFKKKGTDERTFVGKGAFNEGFPLFWSIVFGAILAFIGQIYKTPENFQVFLLLWAVSTISITYIFRSYSTFIFYLALMLGYTASMIVDNQPGTLYYLLFILIIPLYVMEHKNMSSTKKCIFSYMFVILSCLGIGIVFEKEVPGVWIIAYTNLFVLFLMIGNMFEKNQKLIVSPFKLGGMIGIFVMSSILVYNWVWKDIGWNHIRSGLLYNDYAAFFDYLVTALLIISNLVFAYLTFIKNKDRKEHNIAVFIFGLLIPLVYVLVSSGSVDPVTANFIVTLYILGVIIFFVARKVLSNTDGQADIILSVVMMIPLTIKVIIQTNQLWAYALIVLFSFFYLAGIILKREGGSYPATLFRILGIVGLFLSFSIFLFVTGNGYDLKLDFKSHNSVFNLIIVSVVFACEIFYLSYHAVRTKKYDGMTLSFGIIAISVPVFIILGLAGIVSDKNISLILTYLLFILVIFVTTGWLFFKEGISTVLLPVILLVTLFIKTSILTPDIIPVNMAFYFAFLYSAGVFFREELAGGFTRSLESVSTVLSGIFLYIISFKGVAELFTENMPVTEMNPGLVILIVMLLFMIFMFIRTVIKKKEYNFSVLLMPVLLLLIYSGIFSRWAEATAVMWSINFIILLFCLYGFYSGIRKKSVLLINCSAVFLILTVITRFFELDADLLVKAAVFFVSGLIISGMNVIILKTFKNEKKEVTRNE
jgi:uncharacterized membrane protein